MKSEPLDLDIKNEALEIITGRRQYNLTLSDIDTIEIVLNLIKQRIKSAVQGLLKDIEKLESEITDEYKNEWLNTPMKHYCISLLNECKGLIKKWFDVINEEDKSGKGYI